MTSSLSWFVGAPSSWKACRTKFLFHREQRPVRPEDDVVTAFRDGQVTLRKNRRTEGFTQSEKEIGYQGVRVGDLVVHAMDAFAGAIGQSDADGKSTPVYSVCSPKHPEVHTPYYARLLRHMALSGFVESLSKGIRERSTEFKWAELADVELPLPPLATQVRIATFLDEQTARIDALIAAKEKLIAATHELFESRLGTAVVEGVVGRGAITHRAEKGYDAVRADWPLVPLKYIASASGGMTPSKENPDYWGGDIPWVSPKDMKRFELGDSADHVTQSALEKTSLRLHPPFSVLVVVRGMILAHTFPVAINTVPVTINQDMKALRATDRVSVKYLAWMLRGLQPLMLSLTEESAHGTKALRTDQWSNQHVPLPSPEEQVELVSLFERWSEETGVLCAHLQEHISRLREYRSSLISAAVTGQLDIGTFNRDAATEAA